MHIFFFIQDLTSLRWEQPEIRDPKPIGRRSHSALNLDGDLLIFGGYNSSKETHMNDLWLLDSQQWTWRQLRPHGKGPGTCFYLIVYKLSVEGKGETLL